MLGTSCYNKQDLNQIDRDEARFRAMLKRWDAAQHQIQTEMADSTELRPETKPRKAAQFRPLEGVLEEDEMYDYNTGIIPVVVEIDYAVTEVVEQLQVTRDARTGEAHTVVVPAVVSNAGFDPTALENYADWITSDDHQSNRQPDQWAAYEEPDI